MRAGNPIAKVLAEGIGLASTRRFLRCIVSSRGLAPDFQLRPLATAYLFARQFLVASDRLVRDRGPRWARCHFLGHATVSWALFALWVVSPLVLMLFVLRGYTGSP